MKSLSFAERHLYLQAERLEGLPVQYRKALFAGLSTPDDRIAFWQGVFLTYRRQHALSSAQNATLNKAEAMIPVMFGAGSAERAAQEAALAKVSDEVKRVLGPHAQRELFQMAGPDGRTVSLPVGERAMLHLRGWSQTNVVGRVAARIVPSLVAAGDCGCSESQNDCYYEQVCTAGLNGCEQTGGCACDWIIFNCWTCDGVCNYPRPPG
ncbi:hypothetical protein BH18ACI5_BH18ACI5_03790 [soil metagenome]